MASSKRNAKRLLYDGIWNKLLLFVELNVIRSNGFVSDQKQIII
ncbi:hypothetical protein [Clostridium gasigenes]|nr:hypothetical protein [Clostridium gasigenes]